MYHILTRRGDRRPPLQFRDDLISYTFDNNVTSEEAEMDVRHDH